LHLDKSRVAFWNNYIFYAWTRESIGISCGICCGILPFYRQYVCIPYDIFLSYSVSKANQSKVLIYGIAGAIILRFLFILIWIKLINNFHWIIYVFGVLLVYAAIKMLYGSRRKISPKYNIAYNIIKKLIPFKNNTENNSFFITKNKKLYTAPILAALIVVETSDLIFALDSIPAVLSISKILL
jgi:tellurite resistance protein TerC